MNLDAWLYPDKDWTIDEWEQAFRQYVSEQPGLLHLYCTLLGEVWGLMGEIQEGQPEGMVGDISQANLASRRILIRLMQDLRSMHYALINGYPTGASTIASSIAELAFEIDWLGTDEGRVQRWLEHANKRHTVSTRTARIQHYIGRKGPDHWIFNLDEAQEGDVYQQLCMVKHGNSIYQQELSTFNSYGSTVMSAIPGVSRNVIAFGNYAAFHTARLCLLASSSFTEHHVQKERRQAFWLKALSLFQALSNMYVLANKHVEDLAEIEHSRWQGWFLKQVFTRPAVTYNTKTNYASDLPLSSP